MSAANLANDNAPRPLTRAQRFENALTRLAEIGRRVEDLAFGDEYEPADADRLESLADAIEAAIVRRGF